MTAFDPQKEIPRHIAIIMDGNGRWAAARGLPRREGHHAGAESVEEVLRACGDLGVDYLTLYAFSSENWKRPQSEIDALMGLLAHFLEAKTDELVENNIKLQVIGQWQRLPEESQKQLRRSMERTAGNDGLTLVVALSYGSREEIVHAARTLMRKAISGELSPEELDDKIFARHLYTHDLPDPDLLIRTSGECRVSNFLLWQISYAEIVIAEVFWPDFRRPHLEAAIGEYQRRHRRFGGL